MGVTASEDEDLPERMCIVSRRATESVELVRFVRAPDGTVVPDLKRRLPGRGAHVALSRAMVDEAVRRRLFGRAFKAQVSGPDDLGERLDALLVKAVQGSLGLARKAGQLVAGAAKVEAALRSGRALALVQASDAAPDGLRKMEGARRAGAASGSVVPAYRLLSADELGLALDGGNVIHAAVLAGDAGAALAERLRVLATYRGEEPAA